MAKLSELTGLINGLNANVQKIHVEVQKLKNALEDAEIPAEAQTALDNLTTALKGLDDINVDEPTEPPA